MKTDTTFQGFYAIHTDKTGQRRVVRVINEGEGKHEGQPVACLKVRRLQYLGCKGWSGGARAVYGLGNPHWVRTENVTGNWKSEKAALKAL